MLKKTALFSQGGIPYHIITKFIFSQSLSAGLYLYLMQADLLSLEDQLGSGRLPTHIFLLDSLSLPRNQVVK